MALVEPDIGIGTSYRPVALSHAMPRVFREGRRAVEAALLRGCDCGGETATLRSRSVAAPGLRVEVQCDTCGRSISGSLKVMEHPDRLSYPAWDEGLRTAYQARWQDRWAQRQQERTQALEERRQEYHEWLRTSSEWAELRAHVCRRAQFVCEACLENSAEQVHHLTYTYGRLPPAWCLRAVCADCHDRLHAAGDEWCPTF